MPIVFTVLQDHRQLFVDVYRTQGATDSPAQSVSSLRPGKTVLQFSEFDKEPPKLLTEARKKMLRDDVFDVLKKCRPNMSPATKSF